LTGYNLNIMTDSSTNISDGYISSVIPSIILTCHIYIFFH